MVNAASSNVDWERLLVWLETKGMKVSPNELPVECRPRPEAGNGLFATRSLPFGVPILSVPAEALINIKTLESYYPSRGALSLTGIQMISLHLFLHRPADGQPMDPLFGPYISVLPRKFEGHPLTWLVRRDRLRENASLVAKLLQKLPPSVSRALHFMGKKFWNDWNVVHTYIVFKPDLFSEPVTQNRLASSRVEMHDPTTIMDFLWAWLNVNTRCIYHRIKPSARDPDNLTLCPVVDFANHTGVSPQILPMSLATEGWNTVSRPSVRDSLDFVSSGDSPIQAGDELCLTYGHHANRTLFVEYGFVPGPLFDERSGEVDVQDIVESLIETKTADGTRIREILEVEGYWGDWTLHLDPGPAHPSFRLVTALRLYELRSRLSDEHLQTWKDTLTGKRYIISKENEALWRATLVKICRIIIRRSEDRIGDLKTPKNDEGWVRCAYENLARLWIEEKHVAEAVLTSGEEF